MIKKILILITLLASIGYSQVYDVKGTLKADSLDARIITADSIISTVLIGVDTSYAGLDSIEVYTAIGLKADKASPTFTGNVVLPPTTTIGDVNSTELGYLDNVSSNIQNQLNAKASLAITDSLAEDIALKLDSDFTGLDEYTPYPNDIIPFYSNELASTKQTTMADLPASTPTQELLSSLLLAKAEEDTFRTYQTYVDSMLAYILARLGQGNDTVTVDSPAVPTNFVVTGTSGFTSTGTINLSWSMAGSYDSVYIFKSTDGGESYSTSAFAGVDSGTTTYADLNEPAGTTMWYYLRAVNNGISGKQTTPKSGVYTQNQYVEGGYKVSTASSGNGNGLTWENKASIYSFNWSKLKDGDTVFVDGGTDSLVYDGAQTSYSIITISGVAPSGKVVITRSKDASHDGVPVFNSDLYSGIYINNNSNNLEISYLKFVANSGSFSVYTALGSHHIDLLHNEFNYTYGKATQLSSNDINVSYNNFYTWDVGTSGTAFNNAIAYQSDAMKGNFCNNVTFSYNTVINLSSLPINQEANHRDMMQMGDNDLIANAVTNVHHNFFYASFENNGAGINVFKSSGTGIGGTVNFYNNIVVLDKAANDMITWEKSPNATSLTANMYNNTLISTASQNVTARGGAITAIKQCTMFRFKNNLYYAEDAYAWNFLTAVQGAEFSNNQYLFDLGFSDDYSWNTWTTTMGKDANSEIAGFTLDNQAYTSFTTLTLDTTKTDYDIVSASSGVDEGINLSTYFTTDFEDSTRGAVWDAGAFEIVNGEGETGADTTYSAEMITDGAFASGVSNWDNWSLGVPKWYNTDYNSIIDSRVNVLLDSAETTYNAAINYATGLSNGQTYRLRFRYLIPSGSKANQIEVRAYGTSYQAITTVTTEDAWTYVEVFFTANQAHTDLVFRPLYNGDHSAISAGDKIYLDDVSLMQITGIN